MKIALMNDVIPLTFQKNEVVHKRRRKALNPEKEMSAMDRVQEFSSWAKTSFSNALIGVGSLINEKRAESIQKRIDRDTTVSGVLERFEEVSDLAEVEVKNSVKAYLSSANKFSRNYQYLSSVNPFYLSEECPEKVSAKSIFGDNSFIYYSKQKEYTPYSKKFRWVNLPAALTIGESVTQNNFKTISTVYDFEKSTILWNFYDNPQFAATAMYMLVLDSADSYGYLGNVAAMFNKKFFMENVAVSQTQGIRSDVMIIYGTDSDDNVVSARILSNVNIKPADKDEENIYTAQKFILKADYCLEFDFDSKMPVLKRYFENMVETREIDSVGLKAEAMLEVLNDEFAKVSVNYCNDGFLPKAEYSQIRHI